ncbi:MAG: hypothetical protein V3V78_00285 [Candidatus Woesearchaeota archaeon]
MTYKNIVDTILIKEIGVTREELDRNPMMGDLNLDSLDYTNIAFLLEEKAEDELGLEFGSIWDQIETKIEEAAPEYKAGKPTDLPEAWRVTHYNDFIKYVDETVEEQSTTSAK